MRALQESGYLDKAGIRKTQAGVDAILYQLTTKAQVALFFRQITPDTFIEEADEETLMAELAVVALFFERTGQKNCARAVM